MTNPLRFDFCSELAEAFAGAPDGYCPWGAYRRVKLGATEETPFPTRQTSEFGLSLDRVWSFCEGFDGYKPDKITQPDAYALGVLFREHGGRP